MPYLPYVLYGFTQDLYTRYDYIPLCSVVVAAAVALVVVVDGRCVVIVGPFSWKIFCSILSSSHDGYLHLVSTSLSVVSKKFCCGRKCSSFNLYVMMAVPV